MGENTAPTRYSPRAVIATPAVDALVLLLALAWDQLLGGPPALLRPGDWLELGAAWIRRRAPRAAAGPAGFLLAVLAPAALGTGAWLLLRALEPWSWLQILVGAWLLGSSFGLSRLGAGARGVREALLRGNPEAARAILERASGRETAALDPPGLVAETVEWLGERTSRALAAPLLYFALFGPVGAVVQRGVDALATGFAPRGGDSGGLPHLLAGFLNLLPARAAVRLLRAAGRRVGPEGAADPDPLPDDAGPARCLAGLLDIQIPGAQGPPPARASRPRVPRRIEEAWRIVRLTGGVLVLLALAALLALAGLRALGS